MTSRAWLVFGLIALVLGLGVVWLGYAGSVVYQNERQEFVQGAISDAATAAGDPARFERELALLRDALRDGDTGLSPESKLDAERTVEALIEDIGKVDSTDARLTLMRLVARVDDFEEAPDRTVGRAGVLLVVGAIAMFLRAAALRSAARRGSSVPR
ncbi:MAG: hypothetical protein R3E97_19795 [Candidatus Eisenbacteria bacterium]